MSWLSSLLSIKKRFETPIETLNVIRVSSSAILANFDYLKSLQPEIDIFPVLKSNAYGHGIEQVAMILRKRKLHYIVVDSYYEALRVHEVNPTKILLIGYTLPENFSVMDFSWVTPVVSDIETLHALGKLDKPIRFHLKLDTGMGRQGLLFDELSTFLEVYKSYPGLIFEGVCSHFSDADNLENEFTNLQTNRFAEAITLIEKEGIILKYKHIANSAGLLKGCGGDVSNAARVGISLYGVNPLDRKDDFYEVWHRLQLGLEFVSTIVQKKKIRSGEVVSYNKTFQAPWDMEIAVIPVGYYEWVNRKLSSKYSFAFKMQKLPILWRVCMNLSVIDVTNKHIEVGDSITILGADTTQENTVYHMAKLVETIPYEILVKLSESIRRVVVD